jgi:hypothetical protein
MDHEEIRYRILFILYFKHYTGHLVQPQATDRIIEEAGLQFVERNLVYGDVVYLKQSNLISNPEYQTLEKTLELMGPSTAQLKEIKGILDHKPQIFRDYIKSKDNL